MDVEEKMNQVISEFKVKLSAIADSAIGDVYSDVLPHMESDTFMNVGYRCQRLIENMIAGKFVRVSNSIVGVTDDNGIGVNIEMTTSEWDLIRKSLLEFMPQCPKDLEIQSLKKTIKLMEESTLY